MEKDHEKVLEFLADYSSEEACYGFKPICEATRLTRQRVRFICRLFKRKGWAEFYSGLVNEDGDFGGSGYCITSAGMSEYMKLPQDGLSALQSV